MAFIQGSFFFRIFLALWLIRVTLLVLARLPAVDFVFLLRFILTYSFQVRIGKYWNVVSGWFGMVPDKEPVIVKRFETCELFNINPGWKLHLSEIILLIIIRLSANQAHWLFGLYISRVWSYMTRMSYLLRELFNNDNLCKNLLLISFIPSKSRKPGTNRKTPPGHSS